jgi:hypothetical protein
MYYVDVSGEIHKKVTLLFKRACRKGRGQAFLSAFKSIVHRLEQHPHEFGEPLYNLPALKLQVRTAALLPLSVDFSVSQYHDNVVIRYIQLMDAH